MAYSMSTLPTVSGGSMLALERGKNTLGRGEGMISFEHALIEVPGESEGASRSFR